MPKTYKNTGFATGGRRGVLALEQGQIISNAIKYVENKLYEPITAYDVADAVSYSYCHFYRFFLEFVGETIGSYIRSRRLERAAWELLHTNKKVEDIGYSLCFDTIEGFSKAFKERYFMTPNQYRRNGLENLDVNHSLTNRDSDIITAYPNIFSKIIEFPEVYVMGIRFFTDTNVVECLKMWNILDKQIRNLDRQELLQNNRYMIFESGKDNSAKTDTVDSKIQAFIGVEVPADYPLCPGLYRKRIIGGKYAKFIYKGNLHNIRQAYHYIWGVWVPGNCYEVDLRDDFECYTQRFLGADEDQSETDIYLPIV